MIPVLCTRESGCDADSDESNSDLSAAPAFPEEAMRVRPSYWYRSGAERRYPTPGAILF